MVSCALATCLRTLGLVALFAFAPVAAEEAATADYCCDSTSLATFDRTTRRDDDDAAAADVVIICWSV